MNGDELKLTYEKAYRLRSRIREREVELGELKEEYLEIADRLVVHGMYELGIAASDGIAVTSTQIADHSAPAAPAPKSKIAASNRNGAKPAKRQYKKRQPKDAPTDKPSSADTAAPAFKSPYRSGTAVEAVLLALAHVRTGKPAEIAVVAKVPPGSVYTPLGNLQIDGYADNSDEEGWFITDEGDELAKKIRGK